STAFRKSKTQDRAEIITARVKKYFEIRPARWFGWEKSGGNTPQPSGDIVVEDNANQETRGYPLFSGHIQTRVPEPPQLPGRNSRRLSRRTRTAGRRQIAQRGQEQSQRWRKTQQL